MRYIIVGSGIAGITAAQTLRQGDRAAEITVYTNELQTGLYARKDLARHLAAGTLDTDSVYLATEAELAGQGIKVIYDPVLRVFARRGEVLVNHSIRKPYDRLLLATGATPRLLDVPGLHLLGVHQARSYEDFTFIENWLGDIQQYGAVVIGGGVLGLDMAYALAQRGVPVTLVVRESAAGAPWLSAAQGAAAVEKLAEMGVAVRLNTTVTAFDSDDDRVLDRVIVEGGEALPARLALVCAGVTPNTDFLENSGIALDEDTGAVAVSERLQTNFPAIYAAGGCALVDGVIAHNWALSAEQGRVAALNMLGQRVVYAPPAGADVVVPLALAAQASVQA